jgi:hypothetical protein
LYLGLLLLVLPPLFSLLAHTISSAHKGVISEINSPFSVSTPLLTVRIPQPYLGLLLLVSPPLFSLLAHTISSAHKVLLFLVLPPLFSLLAHTISSAHKS